MKISVFTPIYNRGYIIKNLYSSLQRQTFRDFEWIVIDDGSTDNTEELFDKWTKEEKNFPIIYRKVENGGKHRAINKGVQMAKGELFFIVDSDDYLTDDALERVIAVEHSIPDDEKHLFGGVCGKKAYSLEKDVGTTFEGNFLDITMLERPRYGITGDKAEVFYTSVLKKYPFPEFEGENFITESVVWNKIAYDGYKLRFFNDIIYLCDYLPDGLSANSSSLFVKNPHGYGCSIKCDIECGVVNHKEKWKHIYGYYGSLRKKISNKKMAEFIGESYLPFLIHMYYIKLVRKLHSFAKKKTRV